MPARVQLERWMARMGFRARMLQRIGRQMAQDEKKTYADFLIDTSEGRQHPATDGESLSKTDTLP